MVASLAQVVKELVTRDNAAAAGPSTSRRDPADHKREQIKQLLIPTYTRDNGTTFVTNLRRQLRLLKIEEDDPDVCGQLIGKLMNRLTPDLQAACSADRVSQVLDFLEAASEGFESLAEISRSLKGEIYWTNPKLMYNKCKTHLRTLKPEADDVTIEREAWQAVRDAVFHDTPMWAHVAAVRKPPDESTLDALVGQWKAVMEPLRKKQNLVAPTTLNYPMLKNFNNNGAKKGGANATQPTDTSGASSTAAVNAATTSGPAPVKKDGAFQKAGAKTAVVKPQPSTSSQANGMPNICSRHRTYGLRCRVCQGNVCQWDDMMDPYGTKKGWAKLDIRIPRGGGRGGTRGGRYDDQRGEQRNDHRNEGCDNNNSYRRDDQRNNNRANAVNYVESASDRDQGSGRGSVSNHAQDPQGSGNAPGAPTPQ